MGEEVVGADGASVGDDVVGLAVVGALVGELVGDAVAQSTIVTPATKKCAGHPVQPKAYGPMVVLDAKEELANRELYAKAYGPKLFTVLGRLIAPNLGQYAKAYASMLSTEGGTSNERRLWHLLKASV